MFKADSLSPPTSTVQLEMQFSDADRTSCDLDFWRWKKQIHHSEPADRRNKETRTVLSSAVDQCSVCTRETPNTAVLLRCNHRLCLVCCSMLLQQKTDSKSQQGPQGAQDSNLGFASGANDGVPCNQRFVVVGRESTNHNLSSCCPRRPPSPPRDYPAVSASLIDIRNDPHYNCIRYRAQRLSCALPRSVLPHTRLKVPSQFPWHTSSIRLAREHWLNQETNNQEGEHLSSVSVRHCGPNSLRCPLCKQVSLASSSMIQILTPQRIPGPLTSQPPQHDELAQEWDLQSKYLIVDRYRVPTSIL